MGTSPDRQSAKARRNPAALVLPPRMIDNNLETQLRLLTLQLDSWTKLHDLITYGLDKAKPIISAEQERLFTETRANLLQETEHAIRAVRELTNEEVRRLESEWNGVFTKLGVLQGQLKSRRKALAGQTALAYYLGQLLRRKAATL